MTRCRFHQRSHVRRLGRGVEWGAQGQDELLEATRCGEQQHPGRPGADHREAVRDVARAVDEGAGAGVVPLAVDHEGHLAFDHVERLVLAVVDVVGRAEPGGMDELSISPKAPPVVSRVARRVVGTPRNRNGWSARVFSWGLRSWAITSCLLVDAADAVSAFTLLV